MKTKNNKKKIIAIVAGVVIAGAIFQISGVTERFSRLAVITKNIIEGISHDPYEHKEIEISDEELKEINISKMAEEFEDERKMKIESVIKKIEELEEALQSAKRLKSELAFIEQKKAKELAALQEEKPKHTKTEAKIIDLSKKRDLPAEFKPLKKYMHEPFVMEACEICHISYKSKPPKLVTKNIEELCYKCHKKQDTKRVSHKPVKEGRCTECHDPHQSDVKGLIAGKSVNGLCMKCHDSNKKDGVSKKTIDMDKKYRHKPAEKSCDECHEAHTSKYKNLLRREDANLKLCLDCHKKLKGHKDLKAWINNAKFKHGAVFDTQSKCLECHDVHASDHKNILKKEQVDMCLTCHDKEVKATGGGMLMNIKEHLEEHPNWHGPIKNAEKEGGCAACHDPHGSDNFSILRKSFTKNFYGDFDKKDFFCFECHKNDKIKERITTKTGFRDGDVNLHFVHVSDRKGRTCRACHDEHASKYSHLIRDYTDFTGIKFPLRFVESENGGSCAPACHKKFEYDRVIPKSIGIKNEKSEE